MDRRLNLSLVILAISIVALALALDTYGVIYTKTTLDTTGSIITTTVTYGQSEGSSTTTQQSTLNVYSDSACTTAVTSINWGSIAPGGTTSKVIYLKNTGNTPLTLSLSTANWNPTAAASQLIISWNKQDTVLAAGQSVAATVTLAVSSSVSGITSFSTQIIIAGTG